MLVFKEFENNEFSILDTEDNVIESISGEELLNILCTTDLEIKGLSLNSKGFVVDDTKTVLYKPVKAKNSNLIRAKKSKNDEFYTQLSDIEKELSHYPIETFKDKVIYCPCDSVDMSNGYISNFAIYFYNNFKVLGIKKLICTCYSDGINYFEYDGKTELKESRGSDDFRSEYCTRLLQEANIVVTNPPFSLFREFVKWLVDADKKFIIIGSTSACTNDKDIFPLVKSGKLFVGFNDVGGTRKGNSMAFQSPADNNELKEVSTWWFNNFITSHTLLHDKYMYLKMEDWIQNGVEYLEYDNYNAIEVPTEKKIPIDYEGVMGIPVTALRFLNQNIFEIIGCSVFDSNSFELNGKKCSGAVYLNGKRMYARLFIKHRRDEEGILV